MYSSQDVLVNQLVNEGIIRHKQVERAMRAVDRSHFVTSPAKSYAYHDNPLPIGYNETISAPHMHATCLELLINQLKPGARVLDVGSGSGYLSAAMAIMVQPNGRVIGIEKHPELAEQSVKNIRKDMADMVDSGAIDIRAGNALGDALNEEEGFDAIHVGAAAATLPTVLVEKLKRHGRMVIPVGEQWSYQVMQVIDKDDHGNIKKHDLMGVRYVPLTPPEEYNGSDQSGGEEF